MLRIKPQDRFRASGLLGRLRDRQKKWTSDPDYFTKPKLYERGKGKDHQDELDVDALNPGLTARSEAGLLAAMQVKLQTDREGLFRMASINPQVAKLLPMVVPPEQLPAWWEGSRTFGDDGAGDDARQEEAVDSARQEETGDSTQEYEEGDTVDKTVPGGSVRDDIEGAMDNDAGGLSPATDNDAGLTPAIDRDEPQGILRKVLSRLCDMRCLP